MQPRELIGQVLGALREHGAPISQHAQWVKGSVWVLAIADQQVTDATYLPPVQVERPRANDSLETTNR